MISIFASHKTFNVIGVHISRNDRRLSTAQYPQRFWKQACLSKISNSEDKICEKSGFGVELDGKPLRTPDGDIVCTDNQTLALLLASEWDNHKGAIRPSDFPLTSIISRSIGLQKSASERKSARDQLIKYLHTDTLFYHQDYPDRLVKLQDEHWKPLIKWVEEEFGVSLKTTTGMMGIKQDSDTVKKLDAYVDSTFSPIMLSGFEKVVMTTKSYVIGLALISDHLNVKEAVTAARVESLSQTQVWGEIEDAHDLEIREMERQLSCAVAYKF